MWHSTGPVDNRRYQVQVQQTNKGKHTLQGSKPHPETQQKRGICSKTESEHRPQKKKKTKNYSLKLLFKNYSLIPRTDWLFWIKSLSLGKIILFGKSQALKKKKKNSRSKIKMFSEAFHPLHSLATVDAAKANIFVPSLHTPALSSNCFPPHPCKVWDTRAGFLNIPVRLCPHLVQSISFLGWQIILSLTRGRRDFKH